MLSINNHIFKPPQGTRLRSDGHWSVHGLTSAFPLNELAGKAIVDAVSLSHIPLPLGAYWDGPRLVIPSTPQALVIQDGTTSYTLSGVIECLLHYSRVLTPEELFLLEENPWQIFEPQRMLRRELIEEPISLEAELFGTGHLTGYLATQIHLATDLFGTGQLNGDLSYAANLPQNRIKKIIIGISPKGTTPTYNCN